MAPLDQLANQAGDSQAASPGSQNLYAEYMKFVPSMAKKIETALPSNDDTKNVLALTFENIYTSAGGGAAGTRAEDAFQNALNDQLKSDGSALHVDSVHSSMLLHFKQNAYAISDSSGRLNGSGIIAPERVGKSDTPASGPDTGKVGTAGDAVKSSSDSANSPIDATKPKASDKVSALSFPDKTTDQKYNRAAEDAALSIMSRNISSDQKSQAVLDAMNKAGVHSGVDLDNFDNVLSQKLGKNAEVGSVRTQALTASGFRGVVKIDSGRGEHLDVPFTTSEGKLVSPYKN